MRKHISTQGGLFINNHRLGCRQEALCFHINLPYCSSDLRNVNVFTYPGRPLITKTPSRLSGFHPVFPSLARTWTLEVPDVRETFLMCFLQLNNHNSRYLQQRQMLSENVRNLVGSCIYIRASSFTLQIPTIVHRF